MAILNLVPGIEVSVCLDDHPLEEYNDDEEVEVQPGEAIQHQASRTVSKYVEATTNKEFKIRYSVTRAFKMDCPTVSFTVFVDGVRARSDLFQAHEFRKLVKSKRPYTERTVIGIESNITGSVVVKPFKFSEINTTTDDTKLASMKPDLNLVKNLGEICLRVYRRSEAVRSKNQNPRLRTGSKLIPEVHEKILKGQAKSHGVGFGEGQLASPTTWYTSNYLDGIDFPIATFKFKYRSKEALKQLMIIERSPEPEISPAPARSITRTNNRPSLSINNVKNMSQEEFDKVLQGLVRAGQSTSPNQPIKRERAEGSLTGSSRKPKRVKHKVTVTIDLTADSDEENSQVID